MHRWTVAEKKNIVNWWKSEKKAVLNKQFSAYIKNIRTNKRWIVSTVPNAWIQVIFTDTINSWVAGLNFRRLSAMAGLISGKE